MNQNTFMFLSNIKYLTVLVQLHSHAVIYSVFFAYIYYNILTIYASQRHFCTAGLHGPIVLRPRLCFHWAECRLKSGRSHSCWSCLGHLPRWQKFTSAQPLIKSIKQILMFILLSWRLAFGVAEPLLQTPSFRHSFRLLITWINVPWFQNFHWSCTCNSNL